VKSASTCGFVRTVPLGPIADEIVSVDTVERRRISMDLRLNPFLI